MADKAWDECECEHDREEHDDIGCQHVMDSGLRCSCPSFKEAGQ